MKTRSLCEYTLHQDSKLSCMVLASIETLQFYIYVSFLSFPLYLASHYRAGKEGRRLKRRSVFYGPGNAG
jgi:hypothetical protein